ncbi:M48 family metallopeptidase [Nitratiruptor tergarcus]|uniref:YgjP-like metallopeptidase domain-containing protein n=1 Tax=Nitratiruptor tergarcus DSM 16512 TaxID=1069081 RepID=A0A1W1WRC0_9BACT|nr:SprT family zinc-dependent metalloprotease [Nitratiruptor tergarcus]SMC08837.1 hypothetical protein SAMN05660197_0611 [Nitratiruptor tergarcus DSM 16512]
MKYTIVRERRKSIRGFVKNGEIIIKAPLFLPSSVIESFFQKHKDYFARKLQRDYFYYLGVRHKIVKQEKGYILKGDTFYSDENIEQNIESFLIQKAREYLLPCTHKLVESFGEEVNLIKISKAKTRWGSCSSKRNINLSYRLMMLPPRVIDYVIIHEICHLRHMHHGKEFWKLVASRCPLYKEREKELKDFCLYI